MTQTILEKIVETKKAEVSQTKRKISLEQLREKVDLNLPTRNFLDALQVPKSMALIAEVKKASPSAGIIREDFDPVQIAKIYESHGASCISVLTDEQYFQGSLEYLRQVKSEVGLPVLRKDFIIDAYQLWEAREAGADAVLLIAECLDDCQLRSLHNEAIDLGLTPLVELYDPDNLPRVLDAGASLIGVNNRNLHTFEVDLGHTIGMREKVPTDCTLVGESGIKSREDVIKLEAAGVDAILVGETLMRQPKIGTAVDELLGQ